MWKTQPIVQSSAQVPRAALRPNFGAKLGKSKKSEDKVLANDNHDFDLILRPDDPVVVQATRTDDGIDVLVRVVIRNRSTTPLWLDVVGQFKMKLGDRESENLSGGISRPMRKESNQASMLGSLRIYDDLAGKVGSGRISYLFGKSEDTARWILDVDIDFLVLDNPKKKDTQERVAVEIIADRSSYRLRSTEGQ